MIPSPDFTIVSARQDGLEDLDPIDVPNHEIIASLTGADHCIGCHQHINPMGFLFETYNPLGQRDPEQYVVRNIHDPAQWPRRIPRPESIPPGVGHATIASHALPGAQTVTLDGEQHAFSSPDELVNAIARSKSGPACLSVRFFRHLQRRSEAESDACGIAEGFATMRQGPILDAFVDLLVNEDLFWRKP